MNTYHINGKIVSITISRFEGKKSITDYENQIYRALHKIGIDKKYISIEKSPNDDLHTFAKLNWKINDNTFEFFCNSQPTTRENIGSIAQAITEDVRQIRRGIKDLNLLMKQYETPSNSTKSKRKSTLLDFNAKAPENFDPHSIKINKEVNEKLSDKYSHLLKLSNEKLDFIYMNFKQECIRHNTPDHPYLKALKIVRQKRGLEL